MEKEYTIPQYKNNFLFIMNKKAKKGKIFWFFIHFCFLLKNNML